MYMYVPILKKDILFTIEAFFRYYSDGYQSTIIYRKIRIDNIVYY